LAAGLRVAAQAILPSGARDPGHTLIPDGGSSLRLAALGPKLGVSGIATKLLEDRPLCKGLRADHVRFNKAREYLEGAIKIVQ
jgi:hypothetical protein